MAKNAQDLVQLSFTSHTTSVQVKLSEYVSRVSVIKSPFVEFANGIENLYCNTQVWVE